MAQDNTETKTHDDWPIWGAGAIAAEVGLDRGSVYHLLSRNLLPARRIGRRWVSTPGQLRRALTSQQSSGLK
jgi:hypothetical protein